MLESLDFCWYSFDIWARDKNDFSIKILAWVDELHSKCPENKLTTNTFYAGIFNPFHHMNSLREETSDSSGTFWTGLSKFHFMSLIEFFEENQFSGNFRSFSQKILTSIKKTDRFLSENIFKTLSKLQYISLDQHFAGTLFLWEPYNVLKTISDCEQKNFKLWWILSSREFKTSFPESWGAFWSKSTFLSFFHLFQASTKNLTLA